MCYRDAQWEQGYCSLSPYCSPGTHPAPTEPAVGSVGRGQTWGSLAARQRLAGQEPAQPESCWFSHPGSLMSGPAPSAPSACKGQLQRLLQGVKPAAGSAGENLCFAFGFVKGKERSAWACGGGERASAVRRAKVRGWPGVCGGGGRPGDSCPVLPVPLSSTWGLGSLQHTWSLRKGL